MSPPGYSNGHADPVGAEHQALISAVARGVAKLEAAEKSFGLTAKLLVKDSKETRGEVDELKGTVLRIEAQGKENAAVLAKLVEEIGTYPEPVDPAEALARMQTQSISDMTTEQVVEREQQFKAEVAAKAHGKGIKAHLSRLSTFDQVVVRKIIAEARKPTTGQRVKDAAVIGTVVTFALDWLASGGLQKILSVFG